MSLHSLTVAGAFVGVESVPGGTRAEERSVQVGAVVLTRASDVTLVYICRDQRDRLGGQMGKA